MARMKSTLASAIGVTTLLAIAPGHAASDEQSMEQVLLRLDALERQNQQLRRQVEELSRQQAVHLQEALPTQQPMPVAAATPVITANPVASTGDDEWASRIRFNGDFRYRHENIDNAALADDRARETIRVRFGAQISVGDSIDGEIALASGGSDPRVSSATLGAASSRKEIGLDLAYMTWRATEAIAVSAGKMRQPFFRPGMSAFIDNEIRPEGIAVNYKMAGGAFGSAFRFWLDERVLNADSMLSGVQTGWAGPLGRIKLTFGAGYYDYGSVQGRFPGFGNGIVNQFGNTIVGTGAAATYAYDYDIGQLFADATLPVGGVPLNLFVDYARNSAADNGLDTAYNFGFLLGKANNKGRWEAGAFRQRVEKDALFGQWTDSDLGSGVTDNSGQVYRLAWMPLQNLLLNITYLDSIFNVDVGDETDYRRWQLDFNFTF